MAKISQKINTKIKNNTIGFIVGLVLLLVLFLVIAISVKVASDKRAKNLGVGIINKVDEELEDSILKNPESSSVKIYIEGGLNADEKHYSIEMTISAQARTIRVYKGYLNKEERVDTLDNNLDAYIAFLKALDRYKFGKSKKDASGYGWREACPSHRSYSFAFYDGPYQKFDRWVSNCEGRSYGNYAGNVGKVYDFFKDQFPKYTEYTKGISLN